MKIAIFISALSGGGAERVTCNLANYLSDFGHDVDILTIGDTAEAEPLRESIKCFPLLSREEKGITLINNIKRIWRLRRYMKSQVVDAYVTMLPVPTKLMLGFSGLTKAPIIVSERADPSVRKNKIQSRLNKLMPKAAGLVFQTEDAKAWYEPYLKGMESAVIPNAINPVFIRPKYEGKREKAIIGAGRLSKQKNFELLISSFAAIAKEFPEYKLVIYGKGDRLKSLKDLAAELGVGDRVEFPGFATDMPERLEKASMFVLSSDYEGMPNALMEAMALGVPCVSTDCGGGGARFLIQDGENGLLVPQRDEGKMAEAMRKILSNSEFAEKLSQNARKLQEELAPEKIYGAWETFILKKIGAK